jgi:Beta-propeller repeat
MKKFVQKILVVLVCGLAVTDARATGPESSRAASLRGLAEAPLYFEANRGQAEGAARFIARGRESTVLISPTEAVLLVTKTGQQQTRTVRLSLTGANAQAEVSGLSELPGRANYFISNDPAEWQVGVPLFSRVRLDGVYSGVDLVYYAGQSARLEYDFLLQPGADPKQISLHIAGADKVRVDAEGNLVLKIGSDEIRQHKPVIYQTVNGVRKEINGGYRLLDKTTAGFWLGDFNRALPLVIDPVLSFSTYLGGKYGDAGWDIAVDTDGNVYVCGDTLSPDLSTTSQFQTNYNYGGTHGRKQYGDAFVAKFSPSTNGNVLDLSYLTYLGGKGQESALGIAVDSDGNAYVTGFTDSPNFPIVPTNAAYPKISGRNNTSQNLYRVDAFVTKIGPSGTNLIYSTYLGGGERDTGEAIAVDDLGYAYVAGFTQSTNFPIVTNILAGATNVVRNRFGGIQDAFVAKIGLAGTNLVYSTYLGGTNQESAQGIAVDFAGCAYVTGYTLSTNFPTVPTNNAYLNGGTNRNTLLYFDAFFTKISANGDALLYSTFLGAEKTDVGLRIAVDKASNDAYIAGYTYSTNFPRTTNIAGTRSWTNARTNRFPDVFVTKFSKNGSDEFYHTNYSVTFGGRAMDEVTGIAVDALGQACIAGFTAGTNLFGTNILDSSSSITNKFKRNTNNVFVAVLNTDASEFKFNALFGGSGNDEAHGVAIDPGVAVDSGNIYIVGSTTSSNFPTVHSIQPRSGGKHDSNDVFVAKISLLASPAHKSVGKASAMVSSSFVAASPGLSINQAGGNVTLSWPARQSEFSLEASSDLLSGPWLPVLQTPVNNGSMFNVTVPATNRTGFFRLQHP